MSARQCACGVSFFIDGDPIQWVILIRKEAHWETDVLQPQGHRRAAIIRTMFQVLEPDINIKDFNK